MTNFILYDNARRGDLLPLAATRALADMRVGILTIREKWEARLGAPAHPMGPDYLRPKYGPAPEGPATLINAAVCPDDRLADEVRALRPGRAIAKNGEWLAVAVDLMPKSWQNIDLQNFAVTESECECRVVRHLWDIFALNGAEIAADFPIATRGQEGRALPDSNRVLGEGEIFVHATARVEASIFNIAGGPVYIGPGAEVMEGCLVRGPLSLCRGSVLKMGAKVYGATTLGPGSKCGGELNNVVVFGNSNKAHDGFLGNAVLGEWCNLGADSNNSNLKNNYAEVKMWNCERKCLEPTGLQFCGLVMADHAKCGINTMFNTGTVVGVGANVFGAGFPPKYVPAFGWGGAQGFATYDFDRAMQTAALVMSRRGLDLSPADRAVLRHIFDTTAAERH